MEFLGQFDLMELRRTVAGQALPPRGLLSFFMYHDNAWDVFGGPHNRGGVAGGLRVIYSPKRFLGLARRLRPPPDLTADLGLPKSPAGSR